MQKISTLFFLLLSHCLFSQSATDLAIGEWKQHLPFKQGKYVTQSEDKIFYATNYALLIIEKADRSLERMTKVEGLSRVGVDLLKYNTGSDVLLVVYDDGVIDLIREDGILTLFSVPQSNIILGEKKITDVFMASDTLAYISGNFGITSLDLTSGLFFNRVLTPFVVNSVVVYQGLIYAATEDGIYRVNPAEVFNIDDFSNWSWLGEDDGFPPVYRSNAMVEFNDKLYMDINDSLFVYNGNEPEYVHHVDNRIISYLSAEGPHLIAGYFCVDNCNGDVFIYNADNTFRPSGSSCSNRPTYAVEDEEGNIWYADQFNFFRVEAPGSNTCELIDVNSPRTISVYDIAVDNDQVWIATGGLNLTFSALFRQDGLMSLIDGQWREYNGFNYPALSGVSDFLDVKIHPETGNIWSGAFLDALVRYDIEADDFTVFNETNSSLDTALGDPTRSRVAALEFDRDNNMWICNPNAPRPLSVLKPDGAFQSFSFSDCTNQTGALEIAIDALGHKWIMTTNSGLGLVVFDEGDLDDTSDDRCRVINTSNSLLPTNEVNVVKTDLDGAVWVGTKLGAIVFQCDPFNGECLGTRPFIEVDGFGANLLDEQDVLAIGIDGANRKWFGTGSGVFVMSPEGNEQIAHFTSENSPLFDNTITDIAFNYETGEAYIGTVRGLISYRSEATAGGGRHRSNVLVFPNPVRPEYDGPIAIKGLAQDATVKITDISGQLVFETEALGGQAIWNGRDYNDRKVNTGVYLVFATSRNINDPDVAVAKILVVN